MNERGLFDTVLSSATTRVLSCDENVEPPAQGASGTVVSMCALVSQCLETDRSLLHSSLQKHLSFVHSTALHTTMHKHAKLVVSRPPSSGKRGQGAGATANTHPWAGRANCNPYALITNQSEMRRAGVG